VGPARTVAESLTPKPGIREQYRHNSDLSQCGGMSAAGESSRACMAHAAVARDRPRETNSVIDIPPPRKPKPGPKHRSRRRSRCSWHRNRRSSALDERCCATGAEVFPLARELADKSYRLRSRRRRPVALEPFRTWTAHVMQLRPITPSESADDSPHECQDIHPGPPLAGPTGALTARRFGRFQGGCRAAI
jgi:hypothetical protein